MRHYTKILFCLLVLAVFLSFSYAQETFEKSEELTETDSISEKAKASTVRIVGGNFSGLGVGTGFFVGKDRIVTNIHVVSQPGLYFAKLIDNEEVWKIVGVTAFDIKNDLVILKISGEGTPLPLGNSDRVQIGESVYAVGFPATNYKVTEGVINSIQKHNKWLRMTVEVSNGNSGGPILNSSGNVVGVVTAGYMAYSYAISSNTLKALLTETQTETLQQWHQRKVIRADHYYSLAGIKFNSKEYNEAILHLDRAIQLNPQVDLFFLNRGVAKDVVGNHKDAIDDYNQE